MTTTRHRPHSTPFDHRRSCSLDRLIDAEELALAIWARLVSARVEHGGEHPLIGDIAQAAWRAYCRIASQRAAVERAWRVPR